MEYGKIFFFIDPYTSWDKFHLDRFLVNGVMICERSSLQVMSSVTVYYDFERPSLQRAINAK